IDQSLAGEIGGNVLSGTRRSLGSIQSSIGQVARQNVGALRRREHAGAGGRHLEVHRGTGHAVGLDDQFRGADLSLIGDLRVDLSGTDEQKRNERAVDGNGSAAEGDGQRCSGELSGAGCQIGAEDGDERTGRNGREKTGGVEDAVGRGCGRRESDGKGQSVGRPAIAEHGDGGRTLGGDESGGEGGGQLGSADEFSDERCAIPLHGGGGAESSAGEGEGEGSSAGRGRTGAKTGEGCGGGGRGVERELIGGDGAIVDDGDFGGAGGGNQGGGDQRGQPRGADVGGGQRGTVPIDGGGGEEVAAADGEREIGAARRHQGGAQGGDRRGGRHDGERGRLWGNQRAGIDHLDVVGSHGGNRAGWNAGG